jgi:hypothetical protein
MSPNQRSDTSQADLFEQLSRVGFGLFVTTLAVLLIVLYAGMPIPDSWP